MDRELKVWGERWLIRKDTTHAVSFLRVQEGYQCSWHKHQTKYNKFVVTRGRIIITVEELGEIQRVLLGPGEMFTTRPGQWHKFESYTGNADYISEMIEEMYVEYDESDIERKELGGKV